MYRIYSYLAISLLCTVLGFFVGVKFVPEEFVAIGSVILFGAVLAMMVIALIVKVLKGRKNKQIRFPLFLVYLFAFVEGILIYPSLVYYAQSLGILLFLEIVIGTMLIFTIMAFIGQRNPSGSFVKVGKALFIALAIIIIISIINFFLQIDSLSMIISAAGVLVFSLYIMVDINQFKTAYERGWIEERNDYSIYVLNIYLDIINLLLDLLDLVNKLKS